MTPVSDSSRSGGKREDISHKGKLPLRFGPIPVPPPRSVPSAFSSAVVSEAIPITGWGTLEDVRLKPPAPVPAEPLPQQGSGFLPSAIGFSGLVQDEYASLPKAAQSDVSLPEYEFYHYVLWWFRVYHAHNNSPHHAKNKLVDALPLSAFEHLDFPTAPSLFQHLMCLGDFELSGICRTIQPPLLESDPSNLFGLHDSGPSDSGWNKSRHAYAMATSPPLRHSLHRLLESMFPDLPPPEKAPEYFYTSLLIRPSCYCDLRHRALFSSSLQSATYSSSPMALNHLGYSELLSLAHSIGQRLSTVYAPARFFRPLPHLGSPLQLSFNAYLYQDTQNDFQLPTTMVLRNRPSSPEFGYVPDSATLITAAIRLDFNPSIPAGFYRQLDNLAKCDAPAYDFRSYWNRFMDNSPVPLSPELLRARKFESTVCLSSLSLPTALPPVT
jgi:hypothetical protein